MKRILSILFACLVAGSFAWAVPRQASLTPVRAKHSHAQRHHAHKAPKHRQPKHNHRRV